MDEEQDGGQDQERGASSRNDQDGGGGGGGGSAGKSKHKGACIGDCIRKPKVPMIGVKDLRNPRFGAMIFAEVLGTFFLVFMGCGSVKAYGDQKATIQGVAPATETSTTASPAVMSTSDSTESTEATTVAADSGSNDMGTVTFDAGQQAVMIAFAFGITVACIAQAIGHVSGAHLNPAVSFGLVLAGHCSLLQAIIYTFAQILGAILASGLLRLATFQSYDPMQPPKENFNPKDTKWNLAVSLPSVPPFDAFIIEIFLTFLLVLVVCGVCDNLRQDIKGSAPLAIGLTVFVCHVTGMQYSGSSINPARSIGPLPFAPKDDQKAAVAHIWIYIFGPLIGGLEAGATYHIFFREKDLTIDSLSVAPA